MASFFKRNLFSLLRRMAPVVPASGTSSVPYIHGCSLIYHLKIGQSSVSILSHLMKNNTIWNDHLNQSRQGHPIPQGSSTVVKKPYRKARTHSQEVEWWRTFMVECVQIFKLYQLQSVKNPYTFHHQSSPPFNFFRMWLCFSMQLT